MPNFLNPSQTASQYFQVLKSLKPDLNVNDKNSDFVIRGRAISGIVSGLHGDLANINNDPFISTARPSALSIIGQDYGIAQQPATQSFGSDCITIPGSTNGTVITPGQLTFIYDPTGILYTNTNGGTIAGGTITLSVQALSAGQIGNVKSPDALTVVSPPSGIAATAQVVTDIGNGSDAETIDSYRARLLIRRQNAPAGGNEVDYPQFAFEASSAVRSAVIYRFILGLGTVGVFITAGTTNIDQAVTAGNPIVRIPTLGVINTVQDYYNAHVPLTDCPTVFTPTELVIPVSINVIYASGLTGASVPADPINNPLGLTCAQLVQREVGRVLYKYSVGGRPLPGKTGGWVVAEDISDGIFTWLSAIPDQNTGLLTGFLPILADWHVQNLDGVNIDKQISQNQLPAPGVITVGAM